MRPRAARVFYNVVDAWIPEAADVDLLPGVEARFEATGERRAIERALLWLEWEARLRLRSLRGFAWQPREARRELLARWEESRFAVRRRFVSRLRPLVQDAWRQSRDGA